MTQEDKREIERDLELAKLMVKDLGLTDKNGAKIFEGDIVRIIGHESPHVVIFENGYFGLRTILGSPYDQYGKVCPFKDAAPLDIIEVTGNNFDNPDILH